MDTIIFLSSSAIIVWLLRSLNNVTDRRRNDTLLRDLQLEEDVM